MEMNPNKNNKIKWQTLRICLFVSRNDKIQSKYRNKIEKTTLKKIMKSKIQKNPKTQSLSRVEFEFNCSIFRVKYKTIYLLFTQNAMYKMKWSRGELHKHRSEGGQVAHKLEK